MFKLRKSIVFLLVILLAFVTQLSAKVVDDVAPVGMWLFEEGSGAIAADSSDFGNDGTIMGDVTWGKGKFGSGVIFDGNVENYIEVPDSDSLDMGMEMSVVLWFYTDKQMTEANRWGDRQVVLGKLFTEYEVGIYDTGQIHTYTSDMGNGDNGYDEGIFVSMAEVVDPDWKLGTWYHLAWTLKGTKETAYVNGMMIGEFDKNNAGTMGGDNALTIGMRTGGGLPLTGGIDEVAIFNVALSPGMIRRIAEEGLAGSMTAVEPGNKLSTTWANLKTQR